MLDKKLKEELLNIKNSTDFILRNENIVNEKNLSNFLFNMEKYRFKVLDYLRIQRSNNKLPIEIRSINDDYKVDYNKVFKIYIPELVPKNKNIGNYAYKNILFNVAFSTKEYANLFHNKYVYAYIKLYFNEYYNDLDNRCIKPIIDGLVTSRVIDDDSFKNIFYFLKGYKSCDPHSEIIVSDDLNLILKEIKN